MGPRATNCFILLRSLFAYVFAGIALSATAQFNGADVYAEGSYTRFLPGACGAAPASADGLLSYCDEGGNLLVVREARRLMDDGVTDILDDFAGEREVYRTSNGVTVVGRGRERHNVPHAALNYTDPAFGYRQVDAIGGHITADNELLLSAGGFAPVVFGYDLDTRRIRVIPANNPTAIAYDEARAGTWLVTLGFTGNEIAFLPDGAAEPEAARALGTAIAVSALDAAVVGDRVLVATGSRGLLSIDVSGGGAALTQYDASTTGDLPDDFVAGISVGADALYLAVGSFGGEYAVVLADLDAGAFTAYDLAREDGSGDEWIADVAVDGDVAYAVSSTYPGLLRLDPSGAGTWTRTPLSELRPAETPGFPPPGLRAGPTVIETLGDGRVAAAVRSNSSDADDAPGRGEVALLTNGNVTGVRGDDDGPRAADNRQRGFAAPDGAVWWTTTSGPVTRASTRTGAFSVADDRLRLRREAAVDGGGVLIGHDYGADVAVAVRRTAAIDAIPGASDDLEGFAPYGEEVWGIDPAPGFGADTTFIEAFTGGTLAARYPVVTGELDYGTSSDFAVAADGTAVAVVSEGGGDQRAFLLDVVGATSSEVVIAGVGSLRRVLAEPGGGVWVVGTDAQALLRGGAVVRTIDVSPDGSSSAVQDAAVDEDGTLYVTRDAGGLELIRVRDAGAAAEPTPETIDLDELLGDYRPRTRGLALDFDGGLWLVLDEGFMRVDLTRTAPVYRPAGDRVVVRGRVYVDYNDNGRYDRGVVDPERSAAYEAPEGLANVPVRLLDDDGAVRGFGVTDWLGDYRILVARPDDAVTYVVAVPEDLDDLALTQDRSLEVAIAANSQSVDGPEVRYLDAEGGGLAVRVITRAGLWGFEREGFENAFTVVAGNLSTTEALTDVELELAYHYTGSEAVPPAVVNPVVAVRIVPRGGFRSGYGAVGVDPVDGEISFGGSGYNYELSESSFTATATGRDTVRVRLPIGTLDPRETIVLQVATERFDPTTFDEEVIYGVSAASAASFTGGNADGGRTYSGDPFLDPDAPAGRRGAPGVFVPGRPAGSGGPGGGSGDDAEVTYRPTPRGRVLSSYDPNDKLVDGGIACGEDVCATPAPLAERELAYTIRFENEGNFSAFDVVLLDTLDRALDPTTVRVLGSSHEVSLSVLDGPATASGAESVGSILRFDFAGIDLGFEDAVNDGYVRFAIRLAAPATEGLEVSNRASIYFDQNPPIRTNAVVRRFGDVVRTREVAVAQLGIWPNPALASVHLSTAGTVESVAVTDLGGRRVAARVSGSELDVSGLPAGVYLVRARLQDGRLAAGKVVVGE